MMKQAMKGDADMPNCNFSMTYQDYNELMYVLTKGE